METINRTARYLTLRDYLRVLRRYRVAILLIAAIGAAAGYFAAKRETPAYEATSIVSFQDPLQDVSFVGFNGTSAQQPAVLAEQNAETIARPQVTDRVKRVLGVSTLRGTVTSQVSTAGLLDVIAKASTPQFAAQLANAVAGVLVTQSNGATHTEFAGVAQALRRQIAEASVNPHSSPLSAGELPFYEDELARLQTVSRLAHSATVDQTAQPPGAPVSPKPLRSGLIGLAVGLLLGIAVAFFRDSMERRLRNASDIESSFQLPVIGLVRDQVMGKIAQIANGAVDHALDLEAFRILRRNLEFLGSEQPTRSVLVTSALPEEGKTTVAGSLAFAMATAGRKILLVDCDLRRPALAARLAVEPSPGMSDYLDGKASPEQILRQVQFGEPASVNRNSANGTTPQTTDFSLVFIPAGSRTSRAAELLGSTRFKEFLAQAGEVYDVIVLDSSPLLPVADTLEMLPHVGGVIICSRAGKTTRDEAVAAKTALSRFPERPTGVVVTGVNARYDEYPTYTYSYAYD